MKVVIGGASGLVGRALAASLRGDGHQVVAVARDPGGEPQAVSWAELPEALADADAVVNLAGASIGAPLWTAARKQAIRASRIETTEAVVAALEQLEQRPRVFVCASGIDYYGDTGDEPVDESAPAGHSFLAEVCAEWERAAAAAPIRQVSVRTAFVVARGAPSLRLMALPFRFFVGGPLGNGRQFFPWIHRDDLVALYRRAIDDPELEGPVNAVAPEQLRQREAARELGVALNRPYVLPTPAFVLRLTLGEQADLLLHGQRATSQRLEGFPFVYPRLRDALDDAFGG
jgi:uncharacterized protein (TIGR01777 family)